MHIPIEQAKILKAALALLRSLVIDGVSTPSAAFVSGLEQQAGLTHVPGWFPPQLDEESLEAHKTNLLRLESKLLHAEQCASGGIKQWIHRGELPDDVGDVDAALEAACNLMDKANVAEILGMPVFLGDDGLFYVIGLQAEIVVCNPDFAVESVREHLDESLDSPCEPGIENAAQQAIVDGLRQCVEQHRTAVEAMYGPADCPTSAGANLDHEGEELKEH